MLKLRLNVFLEIIFQMYFSLSALLRPAPETVSTSGLRGQPAPSPHHCVSVTERDTPEQLDCPDVMSPVLQPWPFGLFPLFQKPLTTVTALAHPVRPVAQRRRSRQSVGDRGICPGLASGPLQLAECGPGLGGRPERRRPRTENRRSGSAQARRAPSQGPPGSRRVSAAVHRRHVRITPVDR